MCQLLSTQVALFKHEMLGQTIIKQPIVSAPYSL